MDFNIIWFITSVFVLHIQAQPSGGQHPSSTTLTPPPSGHDQNAHSDNASPLQFTGSQSNAHDQSQTLHNTTSNHTLSDMPKDHMSNQSTKTIPKMDSSHDPMSHDTVSLDPMSHDPMSHDPMSHDPMSHDPSPMPDDGSHGNKVHDGTAPVPGQHSGHSLNTAGHYGFFHLSTQTILLFEQLTTSTWQEILVACFVLGVASVFYEGFKTVRQVLLEASRRKSGFITVKPRFWRMMLNWMHLLQSILHVVQVVYAYLLMLAFMTFNGWICISIAIGSGIGYFLFSFDRKSVVDANDHCM